MCGYICIGFIAFMFKGKGLKYLTCLYSPSNFKDKDKIILNFF